MAYPPAPRPRHTHRPHLSARTTPVVARATPRRPQRPQRRRTNPPAPQRHLTPHRHLRSAPRAHRRTHLPRVTPAARQPAAALATWRAAAHHRPAPHPCRQPRLRPAHRRRRAGAARLADARRGGAVLAYSRHWQPRRAQTGRPRRPPAKPVATGCCGRVALLQRRRHHPLQRAAVARAAPAETMAAATTAHHRHPHPARLGALWRHQPDSTPCQPHPHPVAGAGANARHPRPHPARAGSARELAARPLPARARPTRPL